MSRETTPTFQENPGEWQREEALNFFRFILEQIDQGDGFNKKEISEVWNRKGGTKRRTYFDWLRDHGYIEYDPKAGRWFVIGRHPEDDLDTYGKFTTSDDDFRERL